MRRKGWRCASRALGHRPANGNPRRLRQLPRPKARYMEREISRETPDISPGAARDKFLPDHDLAGLDRGGRLGFAMVQRRGEIISPFDPTPTPTRMCRVLFPQKPRHILMPACWMTRPTPTAGCWQRRQFCNQRCHRRLSGCAGGRSKECQRMGRAGPHPDLFFQYAAKRYRAAGAAEGSEGFC